MPRITRRPSTTSIIEKTEEVIKKAFCAPSFFSFSVKTGTYAADNAPSANRSRRRFGIRKAATKASILPPAPNTAAKDTSRRSPSILEIMVASEKRPVLFKKDFFSVDNVFSFLIFCFRFEFKVKEI